MKRIWILWILPLYFFAGESKNQIQWLNAVYFPGLETKVVVSHEEKIPFLRGNGLLTKDNSLTWRLFGEISPVSVNGGAQVSISPLAVLVFTAGGKIGTGWTLLNFVGLALNPLTNTNHIQTPTPFGGVVAEGWISGAFQFDTGAIIPGDWSHVLVYAEQKLNYRMLSSADDETPWLYEADKGQNYNGWKYLTTTVLAYQMPLWLKNVGFLASTTSRITKKDVSPMKDKGWASDFTEWVFGPLAYMEFGQHGLTLLFQWYTEPQFESKDGHFTSWQYRETLIKPYRVALSYAYSF
ncbi:hypothetical protein [Thermospira aquatica]|uniref:Protochlamydia outer membrane protein domain-containing protein n=1 Tax=Thermospira aquatica TaxID=2828656 RepID=A0AAX3BC13_9SPIR|nr:hypothetical protein [Thermospira aquatica]URA09857.1 hypothetical protein KDW03_10285 [Thermospira aquatica]